MDGYAGRQYVGIDLHRRRSVSVRILSTPKWRVPDGIGAKDRRPLRGRPRRAASLPRRL